jgi:hypothetical protein
MRACRTLIVGALVAIAGITAVPAQASSRVPVGRQSFDGVTSNGGQIGFQIRRGRDGALRLEEWSIFAPLTCDDATVIDDHGYGFGFSPGVPLEGRRLILQQADISIRYRVSGRFRNHTASGRLSFRIPAFAADGSPQTCATGPIEWTAEG